MWCLYYYYGTFIQNNGYALDLFPYLSGMLFP